MARLYSFLLIAGLFLVPFSTFAGGNTVTKHFKVNGVCGQCKARIEGAAYVKGVKFAEWNEKTHDLTVKYDSTKTSPEVFMKAIAEVGHDNELYKAEDAVYNKIHSCCRYRSDTK